MLSGLELIWIRAAAHTAFDDRLPYEPNTLYENKKPKIANVNFNEIGFCLNQLNQKVKTNRLLKVR